MSISETLLLSVPPCMCVCVCCCVFVCTHESLCVCACWRSGSEQVGATQQPAERCSQQVFSSDSSSPASLRPGHTGRQRRLLRLICQKHPQFTQPQSAEEKTADLINHLSWSYRLGRLFGWIIDRVIDRSFAQSKCLFPQTGDELDVSTEEFSRWY